MMMDAVGPHIEHWQKIIAAARIRHRYHHRLFGHIEPCDGIERVEVVAHDALIEAADLVDPRDDFVETVTGTVLTTVSVATRLSRGFAQ
jgi:hypothetical protein